MVFPTEKLQSLSPSNIIMKLHIDYTKLLSFNIFLSFDFMYMSFNNQNI